MQNRPVDNDFYDCLFRVPSLDSSVATCLIEVSALFVRSESAPIKTRSCNCELASSHDEVMETFCEKLRRDSKSCPESSDRINTQSQSTSTSKRAHNFHIGLMLHEESVRGNNDRRQALRDDFGRPPSAELWAALLD